MNKSKHAKHKNNKANTRIQQEISKVITIDEDKNEYNIEFKSLKEKIVIQ